jgi:hypothetical protein
MGFCAAEIPDGVARVSFMDSQREMAEKTVSQIERVEILGPETRPHQILYKGGRHGAMEPGK